MLIDLFSVIKSWGGSGWGVVSWWKKYPITAWHCVDKYTDRGSGNRMEHILYRGPPTLTQFTFSYTVLSGPDLENWPDKLARLINNEDMVFTCKQVCKAMICSASLTSFLRAKSCCKEFWSSFRTCCNRKQTKFTIYLKKLGGGNYHNLISQITTNSRAVCEHAIMKSCCKRLCLPILDTQACQEIIIW